MCRMILKVSGICRGRGAGGPSPLCHMSRHDHGPQVLGTEVPSFHHFPYLAQDVLHLYRHLLQLIHRYHSPDERMDLLFRLRSEFAARRHLSSAKMIAAAVRRGQGVLAVQRQLLESRDVRQRQLTSAKHGAVSSDGLWDQLQMVSGHMLPGLRHSAASQAVSGGGYGARVSSGQSVYSRRR